MRLMFTGQFLAIWHKPQKDLISRKSDRGAPGTLPVRPRSHPFPSAGAKEGRGFGAGSGNEITSSLPGAQPGE
jgi:hypothetical protein